MAEDFHQPESVNQPSPALPDQAVTLRLPGGLARAIQQRSQQWGKSPAEVILALLQSALDQSEPAAPLPEGIKMDAIQTRLAALEALIPRLVQLEGKWMAC